jgi:hypothetical protein
MGKGSLLKGYDELSQLANSPDFKIEDIARAEQMIANLNAEYNTVVQNMRRGSSSMNPFVNAINSMDKMEDVLKRISLQFRTLNEQPAWLGTQIADLYTQFANLSQETDIYKFAEGFGNIGDEAFFDCDGIKTITMPESARNIGSYAFASCDELREFIVYSNLTDYADNAFDGCYYINYDAVTIKVEDSSASLLIIIAAVFVVIGVVWYLVYQKKQKKLEKEIQEKIAKREALEAAKAE